MKTFLAFFSVLVLSACSGIDHHTYLAQHGVTAPTAENFGHCRGYGCSKIETVSLNKKQWRSIEKLFSGNADAESEREQIAQAIGRFEQMVGKITGTEEDIAGTYKRFGLYQQDCVDESVNTTTYLSLLEQKGLMKHHKTGTPTARTIFTTARPGPHQTAVLIATDTGEKYAVDSWFHDNGYPAEIVPLKKWKWGWRPE